MTDDWPHKDEFGDMVKYVSEHPGLTVAEIAEATGLTKSKVHRYARNTHWFRKELPDKPKVNGRRYSIIFTIENSGDVADDRKDKE